MKSRNTECYVAYLSLENNGLDMNVLMNEKRQTLMKMNEIQPQKTMIEIPRLSLAFAQSHQRDPNLNDPASKHGT